MNDDTRAALAALVDTHRAYEDAKADLRDAVQDARAAGATWAEVGRALGVKRQTAHERFRSLV
jgi:hypothetical protein